jgi:PAS domain S-box-containing protein
MSTFPRTIHPLPSEGDQRSGERFDLPLEQRGELFYSVLECLFDGVIVTDPQGRILYLNAPMERIGGWSRAEVQGKLAWKVFLEPEHWFQDQHRLPERAAGGAPWCG